MRDTRMSEERSWPTSIDSRSKMPSKSLPDQVLIKKSGVLQVLTFLLAFTGFYLLCYLGIKDHDFFTIATIIVTAGFFMFLLLALWNVLNRAPQVIISDKAISFGNGQIIGWEHISATFIERRLFHISRGNGTERFYLNVMTTFAGEVSGRVIPFSFEITGLDRSPKEIGHLVELYKEKFIKNTASAMGEVKWVE